MGQRNVYDLGKAREARDASLAWVNRTNWTPLAQAAARFHLPYDVELIGEDVRRILMAKGLPPPHTHKCWGGMINGLIKSGVLSPVEGKQQPMRQVKSHARRSPVYVRRSTPW